MNEGLKNPITNFHEVFNGMCTGTVIIPPNTKFVNSGMLLKDVILEENSVFVNNGTVDGNILGSGIVEVFGIVRGSITGPKEIIIHKNAMVSGIKYNTEERR